MIIPFEIRQSALPKQGLNQTKTVKWLVSLMDGLLHRKNSYWL